MLDKSGYKFTQVLNFKGYIKQILLSLSLIVTWLFNFKFP